jgi:Family of unknown function (DUF5330)
MVNDRLPEMCFVLAQIETMRLPHGIWPHPERDHSTFMKICGAFAFKLEPGFQSSLLLWWLKAACKRAAGNRVGVMRFLLRVAFWLGVVLVLLPSTGTQPTPKSEVGTVEAISAARAAVGDLRTFCDRQPEACSVGSQAVVAIGHRAQAGAKMLYEFLNEQLGPQPADAVGSTGKASQHNLTATDLEPAWRGHQPHRN